MAFIYGRNLLLDSTSLDDFEVLFSVDGTKEVINEPLSAINQALHINVSSGDVYLILRPKKPEKVDTNLIYTFSTKAKTNVSGVYESVSASLQPEPNNPENFEVIFVFNGEGLTDVYLYDLKLEKGYEKTPWSLPPENIVVVQGELAITSQSEPIITTWVEETRTRIVPYSQDIKEDIQLEPSQGYFERGGTNGEVVFTAEFQYINGVPTNIFRNEEIISSTPAVNEIFVRGTMIVDWRPDTRTETLPYRRTTINDNTILPANSYIQTAGVNGSRTIAFEVKYTNGNRTTETRYERIVSETPAINEIYMRGTMSVEWRNETRSEYAPFERVVIEDNTIDARFSGIDQEGVIGETKFGYQRKFINGVATNETRNETTTSHTDPVNEIYRKGIKPLEHAVLTNLVNNGDFSDGTTGWINQGGAFSVNPDGHLQYKATSRNQMFYSTIYGAVAPERKYYIKARMKSSTKISLGVNRTTTGVTHSGSNQWENLSFIHTSQGNSLNIGLIEMSTNFQTHLIDYFIVIDLTMEFGVDAEPDKDFMDYLLKHSGYFSDLGFNLLPRNRNLLSEEPTQFTAGYDWYFPWETTPIPTETYYVESSISGDLYPVTRTGDTYPGRILSQPGYYLGSELAEFSSRYGLRIGFQNITKPTYTLYVEETW